MFWLIFNSLFLILYDFYNYFPVFKLVFLYFCHFFCRLCYLVELKILRFYVLVSFWIISIGKVFSESKFAKSRHHCYIVRMSCFDWLKCTQLVASHWLMVPVLFDNRHRPLAILCMIHSVPTRMLSSVGRCRSKLIPKWVLVQMNRQPSPVSIFESMPNG